MLTFGPVPSRRLGRSLGVNNIPPKTCTYSCVYCQVGRTRRMSCQRQEFYAIENIVKDAGRSLTSLQEGESIDYATFVADGEPTLDIHLGMEIKALKRLGLKVAVITNASLIWREDVRKDLAGADWVSLKVDAVSDDVWRKINRPHKQLIHSEILNGLLNFAATFTGQLVTETMLVQGINDGKTEIEQIAELVKKVNPTRAYIAVPTRPPAEKVFPPDEEKVNLAYQVFRARGIAAEYLIKYEGNEFSAGNSFEEAVLSITAVHPMRQEAVEQLVEKHGKSWTNVDKLLSEGRLIKTSYKGETFFLRAINTQDI